MPTYEFHCINCGKRRTVYTKPSRTPQRFCSLKCYGEYSSKQAKKTQKTTACKGCGKPFKHPPGIDRIFCSQECAKNFRATKPRTIVKICETCGAEFEVWECNSHHKYCSRECSDKGRRKRVEKKCPHCGERFSGAPEAMRNRKYCGHECANAAQRGMPKKEGTHWIVCEVCGEKFPIDPHRGETAKYCSVACAAIGKIRTVEKKCAICGTPFSGKPSTMANKKYCSKSCRYKAQSIARKGKRKGFWTTCTCRICGKKFEKLLSYVQRGGGKYCSRSCLAIGRNMEAFQSSPTSIERLMHQELDRRKISYAKQYPHNRFLIDIAIPEAQLAIECDGIYWHSRPENITKDKRKNTTLKRAGWTVLRFTGDEIRASPERCVDIIEQHLRHHQS